MHILGNKPGCYSVPCIMRSHIPVSKTACTMSYQTTFISIFMLFHCLHLFFCCSATAQVNVIFFFLFNSATMYSNMPFAFLVLKLIICNLSITADFDHRTQFLYL